jgi:uncharacterized ion transporter superfamily protein YfcC
VAEPEDFDSVGLVPHVSAEDVVEDAIIEGFHAERLSDRDVGAEPAKRGFPSPLTTLTLILVLVWVAAFFIPSGQYRLDDAGSPIAGSYERVDSPLNFGERVQDLLYAPINGLYGIQDPETGFVSPFGTGNLFGLAQVFLFILAIGGFMTVVFRTGALDIGIAHLAKRFSTRGPVLIVSMCILFGLLGSVMSWSDETLGMYALLIPLFLALGYDRVTTVAVVTVAPFVGIIGSTVNPFRIGIGSEAAGVSIGDGIVLRVVLFVLCMAAMIWYTLRYAKRVKLDPSASLVAAGSADADFVEDNEGLELEPLSGRHKAVIGLVAFTFALLTFSIIPWGAILNNTLVDPDTHETISKAFVWELGWWLPELTAMFCVMAVVIGVVGRLGEAETAGAFIKGVVDFTGPAILVTVARGISVVLTNTQTIDTVLNAMEGFVDGQSNVVFVLLLSVASLPLGFLIGAGAAGNALVMPILAPLGDFAGVDRSLVVTTYNAIGGWLNLILPLNAILVAGLALAKVGFDAYVKFIVPLMGILIVIILAVLMVGVAL